MNNTILIRHWKPSSLYDIDYNNLSEYEKTYSNHDAKIEELKRINTLLEEFYENLWDKRIEVWSKEEEVFNDFSSKRESIISYLNHSTNLLRLQIIKNTIIGTGKKVGRIIYSNTERTKQTSQLVEYFIDEYKSDDFYIENTNMNLEWEISDELFQFNDDLLNIIIAHWPSIEQKVLESSGKRDNIEYLYSALV